MEKNRPQLIVLTPVRNEAWVLRAFLAATSLWADKIIIADQMSTDGSREIYKEFQASHPKSLSPVEKGEHYCELIVIDNDRKEMHQAATRRLLFDKAREILNGDTNAILFALDADEFLSGDFIHTEDWKKILNSQPDDVFCWRWMNLKEGDPTKYSDFRHYYWAVHVSETLWEGEFSDNFIHEWRLPWPPDCTKEKEYNLDEIRSIHFARVNTLRQRNKERFYQVSSVAISNRNWNALSIYRMYHKEEQLEYFNVPKNAYTFYEDNYVDIGNLINLQDDGQFYTDAVIAYFKRDGLSRYAMLDIWNEDWCERQGVKNPQIWYHRMILSYLHWSNEHRNLLTKVVDKIWQKLG